VYNASSTYAYCYNDTCATSGTGNAHFNLNADLNWTFQGGSFNRSDSYELVLGVDGYTAAEDYSYGATLTGATATSFLNMAAPNHGANLTSITIW
jgi:hypothetical protein